MHREARGPRARTTISSHPPMNSPFSKHAGEVRCESGTLSFVLSHCERARVGGGGGRGAATHPGARTVGE